jgi:hypothetical protein
MKWGLPIFRKTISPPNGGRQLIWSGPPLLQNFIAGMKPTTKVGRRMNQQKSVFPSLAFHRWAKVAVPSILLVTAVSSPSLSATIVLGPAQISAVSLAKTCFDNACTQQEVDNGNASTVAPDSTAQTTAVLSTAPSISGRSEADVLPAGGSAPNTFMSSAQARVTLSYSFEIVGPQNISLPITIAANGNIAVTGNFASTGYFDYLSEARLLIPVANEDISIDSNLPSNQNGTVSDSFAVDGTYTLQSNTAYQVLMQVSTGVDLVQQSTTTALADLIATASIDPSFQLSADAPSGYSIIFSDGIGDTPSATPLPATLPLFAGGLGFVGYLVKRRNGAKQAPAAA